MARQIITGDTIHQALAEGQREIRVEDNGIVTDAARELAESRGLRLVRGAPDSSPDSSHASTHSSGPSGAGSRTAPTQAQVRAAVVTALGDQAPADVDEVIARVLREGH